MKRTHAVIRWQADVNKFREMRPGDRNNTLFTLAIRGRSLEIREFLKESTAAWILIAACEANGLVRESGRDSCLTTIYNGVRAANRDHDDERVLLSSKPVSPLVRPASCTPNPLQHYTDDVYRSSLPPSAKRQLYIAAVRYRDTGWTTLVMSARAMAVAAKVDKGYVGSNWRKAEKLGFIYFNPGLDYQTATEHGLDARSNEITLNLDIYPDTPVESPLVDLDDYVDAASNIRGYIKYRQKVLQDEKRAYMRENNKSCIDEDAVRLLKQLLNMEK